MRGRRTILLIIATAIIGVPVIAAALYYVRLAGPTYLAGSIALTAGGFAIGLLHHVTRVLERSEERLRAIVDSVQDGIVTTDAEGMIESMNASISRYFGYRPGQITGNHLSILFASAHGEHFPGESLRDYFRRSRLEPLGTLHEVVALRQDGTRFQIEIAVSEAEWNGKPFYAVMIRDISDRVAAQKMLREAKDELERHVKERTTALEESNERLHEEIARRKELISELQSALGDLKTLSGLLPICSSCKKIRDDRGYWSQIEVYISEHSDAEFSHGICPDCIQDLYPELHGQISDT